MSSDKNDSIGGLQGWLAGLRSPFLFVLVTSLFFLDLALPDLIPFVDEILLAMGSVLLARWKSKRNAPRDRPPPKNVTPS